ncbi:MAG: formylglycine-generating enzyme family protein [Labilithrix sp.]|nr:formylglycine-generating enzyme family protein [Labilithrix sp.]
MCLIPAGCYVRGSPKDEPWRGRYSEEQREVTLTHPLLVGHHEVTHAEWTSVGYRIQPPAPELERGFDGARTCSEPSCPATRLTWHEAVAFANEKSRREGLQPCVELLGCSGRVGEDFECTGYRQTTPSYYQCDGYRLPTSVEFEYVARAGTTTTFYSGRFEPSSESCIAIDHLTEAAWYCANSDNETHPVGLKKPNPWGLFDIMGNVMELTASVPETDTVGFGPQIDPQAVLDQSGHFVISGGAFNGTPPILRLAYQTLTVVATLPRKNAFSPSVGFRLVRTVSAAEAAAW